MKRLKRFGRFNKLFIWRFVLCFNNSITSEIDGLSIMFGNQSCRSFEWVI
jgi:hypothetical protein